jgi:predicted nucleic acid-binding Zn ribbon protein
MPEICPKCGKKGGIHKLISEASFTLKGNGWYATDYKSSRKSKKEETENKISTTKTDNNKPKEETKK